MLNKMTKIVALGAFTMIVGQASFAADQVPTAHQSIQPITETILLSEKFGKNTSVFNFKSTAKKAAANDRLAAESISDDLLDDDFVSGVVVSSTNGVASTNLSASVENIAEDEFFIGANGESGVVISNSVSDSVAFVPTAYRSIQPLTDAITIQEKYGPVAAGENVGLANR